jgi:hypothetical protein
MGAMLARAGVGLNGLAGLGLVIVARAYLGLQAVASPLSVVAQRHTLGRSGPTHGR